MIEAPEKLTGTVTAAHYNETLKAIRFTLKFENGYEQGFEWPITMFKFPVGSDPSEEMMKTAKLMPGKKISVVQGK